MSERTRRRIGRGAWLARIERHAPHLLDAAGLVATTPTRELIDWQFRAASMGVPIGELLRQRDELVRLGFAVRYPDGGMLHTSPAPTTRKAGRNDASHDASV